MMKSNLGWMSLALMGTVSAGPFSDDDALDPGGLSVWADHVEVIRGPVDATVPDGAVTTFGDPEDVVGPPDAGDDVQLGVVSLGDGGVATIRFAEPVGFGPGADLAVFENGFSADFLELAHVEVSSNGIDFVRFPSVSLTPTDVQIGGFDFGAIDQTDLHHLAGKYEAGRGTPFDLDELRGAHPRLDISHITHVRVIDVVGSLDAAHGSRDSLGNLINDPFKTNFPTGGFDLDAVGAVRIGPVALDDWKALHFPDGLGSDDFDDPDGDGVANLLEYALAGDPRFPTGPPLDLRQQAGEVSLGWDRAEGRDGVTLKLEGSTNLHGGWTVLAEAVGAGATVAMVPDAVAEEALNSSRVSVTLDNRPERFFRLRAE